MLSKRVGIYQWLSVVALAGGVALVQLSQLEDHSESKKNSFLGLISVLFCCVTSGFAGVYFEMVLKSSKPSIWLRNVQLSLIGGILAMFACYYRDFTLIQEKGFLHGYDKYVRYS
jgi:UDP-sugar transporter A1/2/3